MKRKRAVDQTCYKCGEAGHWANNCPNSEPVKTKKEENKCYKCNQSGHWANNCPNSGSTPAKSTFGSTENKCFKCNQSGHWANNCPNDEDRDEEEEQDVSESEPGAEMISHPLHPHSLAKKTQVGSWRCDGMDRDGGCRGGITEYDSHFGVLRYRCSKCDYDLCGLCISDRRTESSPIGFLGNNNTFGFQVSNKESKVDMWGNKEDEDTEDENKLKLKGKDEEDKKWADEEQRRKRVKLDREKGIEDMIEGRKKDWDELKKKQQITGSGDSVLSLEAVLGLWGKPTEKTSTAKEPAKKAEEKKTEEKKTTEKKTEEKKPTEKRTEEKKTEEKKTTEKKTEEKRTGKKETESTPKRNVKRSK